VYIDDKTKAFFSRPPSQNRLNSKNTEEIDKEVLSLAGFTDNKKIHPCPLTCPLKA